MTLFDANDADELRAAIEELRDERMAFATQLASIVEHGSADPVAVALAASFRAGGVRERRLRNALRSVVAG